MTEFDTWYAQYPNKKKRGDARKAWYQTADIRPPMADMLAALEWQRRQPQWVKDGGQFIPYPATYLRAEQWADMPVEIAAPVRAPDKFDAANAKFAAAQATITPEERARVAARFATLKAMP